MSFISHQQYAENRRNSVKKRDDERKMPSIVAKRNARERTRVHTVNQAFLILKQHLPSLRQFTKRVSKLRILNAAINYIEALANIIETSEPLLISTKSPPKVEIIKAADTSLVVDYSTPLPGAFATLPTVFTSPPPMYMKSLLDYPAYFYPTPNPQHVTIMNNPIIPMPTYQCM